MKKTYTKQFNDLPIEYRTIIIGYEIEQEIHLKEMDLIKLERNYLKKRKMTQDRLNYLNRRLLNFNKKKEENNEFDILP